MLFYMGVKPGLTREEHMLRVLEIRVLGVISWSKS